MMRAFLLALVATALVIQAQAQSNIDGVYDVTYNLGPGLAGRNLATLVDIENNVALFRLTGGPNYGVAIARPDQPDTWDIYVTTANLTITTNGTVGLLSPWDRTAPVVGQAVRVPPPDIPRGGYPSFEGAWNAANGAVMTCLQSETNWIAYLCIWNRALPNGTVIAQEVSVFQDESDTYEADVNVHPGGNQTWYMSPDNNTITIRLPNGSFVINMTRQSLPLARNAPSMAGLFRSDPATQVMGCGVPASAPAAALCMGAGLQPGTGAPYVFSVVERQSADGRFTDQITSVGLFSSRWADDGNFKRQFFFGQATNASALLLTVGYRTDTVQTLLGTWEFGNVTATCAGGSDEAITCVGSGTSNGTAASFNMAARGLGLGQYETTFLYQLGNASAYFKGVMRVAPDGGHVTYNTSAIRFTGLAPGSVTFS